MRHTINYAHPAETRGPSPVRGHERIGSEYQATDTNNLRHPLKREMDPGLRRDERKYKIYFKHRSPSMGELGAKRSEGVARGPNL